MRLEEFNPRSGTLLERLLFNHRPWVLALCLLATCILGWQASKLTMNASFDDTIPAHQSFIVNYLKYRSELKGVGNAVRIAVVSRHGSIYSTSYLNTLRKINDAVFLIPGVDRLGMKSLWTPNTRWAAVTQNGLDGGPVIPDDYDGSARTVQQVKQNVARSGEVGELVADDARSSVIYVPLLSKDPNGEPLDYAKLTHSLDEIRRQYAHDGVQIRMTGFAVVMGDLIHGMRQVMWFFLLTALIATTAVFLYTRCLRSTVLVVAASLLAVLWQLGILHAIGFTLNPYSMLVPFLVFAIGMSHGAQKMNGIMQDVGRGAHRLVAARYTFRRLFVAGLAALLADAMGFAVLLLIDIKVIRELAIAACIGVALLVTTNLILLPILLSYFGVSERAAARSLRAETELESGRKGHPVYGLLVRFTSRRWAWSALAATAALLVFGIVRSQGLQIGDVDAGAPELRPDSVYNLDAAYMNGHYGASTDVFAVMVKTPPNECSNYATLMRLDALEWDLRQLDGVASTNSLALYNRRLLVGYNEGNPRWWGLSPNQKMINFITSGAPTSLFNPSCSLLTLYTYLSNHKASTLTRLIGRVRAFAAANDTPDARFLLAAGDAGIQAATNIVVRRAWNRMVVMVYGAVALLCMLAFRSWRAVVVALVPLVVTTYLVEALMVALHMGVRVATLPVIAVGVGIGVDYALYTISVTLVQLRAGQRLEDAYYRALTFTGKVVVLTGLTLSAGVAVWAFSPIKFQADMGVLLAFMFLWNMVGALVLIPALGSFLLKPRTVKASAAASGAAAIASHALPGRPGTHDC
jgi:predicted RND superfamily exporter protein